MAETMTESEGIVERLRDTPNWKRESFSSWKDCVSVYDRTPFEAAALIERQQKVIADLVAKAEPFVRYAAPVPFSAQNSEALSVYSGFNKEPRIGDLRALSESVQRALNTKGAE